MIRYADDWPETRCVVCCVEDDDHPTSTLSYYKLDYSLRHYPAHRECAEWAMDARRHIAKLNGSSKYACTADEDGVEESYSGRFGLLLGGLR